MGTRIEGIGRLTLLLALASCDSGDPRDTSGTPFDPAATGALDTTGIANSGDDTESGNPSATASGALDTETGVETAGATDTGAAETGPTDTTTSSGESGSPPVEPPPGLPCDASFEHAGYEGCRTTVEGLEIKFFPLDEPVPAQRLVVFLHGDTGADYIENWGFREEILDWAVPQDFLVVGIRSPASYEGDSSPSFGAAQPVHADMVATTLEAVIEAYDVVHQRALYWGISGGSWFTTSSFIPVAGHRVPGIFVANCGGSGASFGWAWDPSTTPEFVGLNALLMNYGDQDFLAEPSAQSYAEYMQLGFAAEQLVHPGAPHCAHPIGEPTLNFWMDHL